VPPPPVPLEARDPELIGKLLEAARWLGENWFRWRCGGVDNVPPTGPALLVGNHSGGLFTWDALLVILALWDRFGPDRALYSLGHDLIQWDETLRRYGRRIGALRASHEDAERAFAAGHLVLVYPGSEFDSFRPFRERSRVVFAGRTGFVRLALRNRVPIVPVVSAGAQEQFVVLTRGERIAEWLGLKRRIRASVFPIALALPWGLTSAYLPHIPLPTQITISFLPPLRWDELGPEAERDEAIVRRCYEQVVQAMQDELDRLYAGRLPWIGRRAR
jgi:1-acyl-sn-glycerol-3-phosphate acyltransferase